MDKTSYRKMTDTVSSSDVLKNGVIICDSVLTKVTYIVYAVFIVILAADRNSEIIRAIAVPGISFVILSVFRHLYNAPRPYEVFDTAPVINKTTKGKSMPSRHVFSIFVIAVTVFYFNHAAGICLLAAGVILAVVRVVGGVHFPADVIAGAAVGIICGAVGFYMI